MEEIEKPKDISIINGYIAPSQIFILDYGECNSFVLELVLGYNLGYIVKGINNQYKANNYKCYNDFDVFCCVYRLGKELTDILYDTLIEQNICKNIFANVILGNMAFVLNLSKADIEQIKPIIMNWIKENGMPFITEREDIEELDGYIFARLNTVIDRCITLYTFYTYLDLIKKEMYYGELTDKERKEFERISKLFNFKGDSININNILTAIRYLEMNNQEIDILAQERLMAFVDKENNIKYRNVRYYSNMFSAAWHKMKLMICEDVENSTFRTCRRCNMPYKTSSNNQRYCIYCQDLRKNEKHTRRYRKILELHQELIEKYSSANITDEEIEKVINLRLKEDIKKVGVERLEELLRKLEEKHSL